MKEFECWLGYTECPESGELYDIDTHESDILYDNFVKVKVTPLENNMKERVIDVWVDTHNPNELEYIANEEVEGYFKAKLILEKPKRKKEFSEDEIRELLSDEHSREEVDYKLDQLFKE